MKDFLFPILTFLAGGVSGALWPHVQRPLTDYRETVSKISEQIEKGAQMLVGILNQATKTDKDLPHLTECIRRLGTALDIAVSR